MRIGIIQTRGLGDIVIATPIALHFIKQGHDLFWPIDSDFIGSFAYSFPQIQFIPIDKNATGANTAEFFIEYPKRILESLECEKIHILYSHLTTYDFNHKEISETISFDNYKYAVAGVPFSEKWNFHPKRNPKREAEIFNILNLEPTDDYVVVHDQGSVYKADFKIHYEKNYENMRIIRIENHTNNIMDWLGVIENCYAFYGVNSVFANLVEQMSIDCKKYISLQTNAQWTPVLMGNWTYI